MTIILIVTILALAVWAYWLTRHVTKQTNTALIHVCNAENEAHRAVNSVSRLEHSHQALLEDHIALAANIAHVQEVHLGLKGTEHVFSTTLKP